MIRRASSRPGLARGLAEVLVDCVEAGASVSFMLPLEVERAEAFWSSAIESSLRGERILLVAEDEVTGHIVGTVQVLLLAPENQPHRGEVAKMLVHRRVRRRGVAEALMRAAETSALEAGKTLLVLDASSDAAERLYDRLGWRRERRHCRGDLGTYRQQGTGTVWRGQRVESDFDRRHTIESSWRPSLAQGPGGRTRDHLYNEARERGINGRSKMNKAQLARAVGR